jgi:hypothetical protein
MQTIVCPPAAGLNCPGRSLSEKFVKKPIICQIRDKGSNGNETMFSSVDICGLALVCVVDFACHCIENLAPSFLADEGIEIVPAALAAEDKLRLASQERFGEVDII